MPDMPNTKTRKKKTQSYSIGKVADAAGVSVQTVRVWERLGHVASTRTPGGQRVYSELALRRVIEKAAAHRRKKSSQRQRLSAEAMSTELASTGARIRRARTDKGLSQAEAAALIGISRSFLAAVERGESGVSIKSLSRMADVFSIPMSKFAAGVDPTRRVMRVADRPRTVVGGGVTWEELAPPGSHDMEPALLHVPPGQTSGGFFVRPGDSFAFVQHGGLTFEFGDTGETMTLAQGDALIVPGGTPFSWQNTGRSTATCLWVELISMLRKPADP
jgi:DNA-binding XRE family transcriptional regulator/quercetin dioxygenase-like cupin family protein